MKKALVILLVNVLCVFAPIVVMAQSAAELTNLVLFVRFADDAERLPQCL